MCKIQLTIAINFISCKDDHDEEHVMYSKSDNIEIMINDEENKVTELFKLLQKRYQNNLEKLVRGSEFVFDYVYLLYYKCHKINPNCGGSYIDFLGWTKSKKATINQINKREQMLSLCYNSHIKSWQNQKRSPKNNKN